MPNGDKLVFYVHIQIFNHVLFLVGRLERWYLICEQSKNSSRISRSKCEVCKSKEAKKFFLLTLFVVGDEKCTKFKCDWIEFSLSKSSSISQVNKFDENIDTAQYRLISYLTEFRMSLHVYKNNHTTHSNHSQQFRFEQSLFSSNR